MNLNFLSKFRCLRSMSSLEHSRLQWVNTLCVPMRPQGILRLFVGTILLIWGPLQKPIWSWRIYFLSLCQQGLQPHTEGPPSSSSQTGWTKSSLMRHWYPPSRVFLATWRKPCFRMLSKAMTLSSMLQRLRGTALIKEMYLWTSMAFGGSQTLQMLNGFILPFIFQNGLPYLPTCPFSNHEWDMLPHIVLLPTSIRTQALMIKMYLFLPLILCLRPFKCQLRSTPPAILTSALSKMNWTLSSQSTDTGLNPATIISKHTANTSLGNLLQLLSTLSRLPLSLRDLDGSLDIYLIPTRPHSLLWMSVVAMSQLPQTLSMLMSLPLTMVHLWPSSSVVLNLISVTFMASKQMETLPMSSWITFVSVVLWFC